MYPKMQVHYAQEPISVKPRNKADLPISYHPEPSRVFLHLLWSCMHPDSGFFFSDPALKASGSFWRPDYLDLEHLDLRPPKCSQDVAHLVHSDQTL